MKTETKDRGATNASIETAGEFFPDGSAMELVRRSKTNELQLLFWNNDREPVIARQIRRGARVFVPVSLHPSLLAATRLPTGAVDRGSAAELQAETQALFTRFLGTDDIKAAALAAWGATTYFADQLSSPPALYVCGAGMNVAVRCLRLLHCICRHPILLGGIKPSVLGWLTRFAPTLLLNQPSMSRMLRALLAESGFQGLVLPGPSGTVFSAVCSKAIFVGQNRSWNAPGIRVVLPPTVSDLPRLDVVAQRKIAERFQPWFLWHRLRNLQKVRRSRFADGSGNELAYSLTETASILELCSQNGKRQEAQWMPLLEAQQRENVVQQARDPKVASIEILWPLQHSSQPEPLIVKELSELVNALLESRGELRRYSEEEIGADLRDVGIPRTRRGPGMFILFDRDTSRALHEAAKLFGIGTAVAGCEDCVDFGILDEPIV